MKVIALDVDGVLREKHWEAGKPQILIPATAQKLWAMEMRGICISNQAGCYWGYSTIATKIAEFRWLMGRLPIQRCYFCPDYGSAGIWVSRWAWNIQRTPGRNYRKPGSGLFDLAKEQGFQISLYVGDMSGRNPGESSSDALAAHAAIVPYLDIEDFWKIKQ